MKKLFLILTLLSWVNFQMVGVAYGIAENAGEEDPNAAFTSSKGMKSFEGWMTHLGALMAFIAAIGSFKVTPGNHKMAINSRKLAITRVAMSLGEGSLSLALIGLMAKEKDDIDHRIEILEKMVASNSPHPHLPPSSPSWMEMVVKSFEKEKSEGKILEKFLPFEEALANLGDASPLKMSEGWRTLRLCINQLNEIDPECQCRLQKTCRQLPKNFLPQELEQSSELQATVNLSNQLMRGDINPDKLNLVELYNHHQKLSKLVKSIYQNVNKKRLENGIQPYPELKKLQAYYITQSIKNVMKQDMQNLQKVGDSFYHGKNKIEYRDLQPKDLLKKFQEIQDPQLSEESKGDGEPGEGLTEQTSDQKNGPANDLTNNLANDLVNKEGKAKKFKIDSVAKDSKISLWKLISTKYLKIIDRLFYQFSQ